MLTIGSGIVLVLMGILLGIYWYEVYVAHSRQRSNVHHVPFPKARRRRQKVSWEAYKERDDVNPILRETLLNLVKGDIQEAERLVGRARFATPGRSEDFYWLKAIRTLEEKLRQDATSSAAIDPERDT